jgi:nucleotide-binding universal stress UspA family protein
MFTRNSTALVLVGVDGSAASLAALDWAVGEAEGRHCPLRIVHAFIWPSFPHVPLGPSPYGPPEGGLRVEADRILDRAVRRACEESPGVTVQGMVRPGWPVPVLLDEAADAGLIVVGSRGLGGFAGLLMGSVSSQVAEHARRPVVVTRPPALDPRQRPTHDRVVVGMDGSPEAADALAFAVDEAVRLDAGLTAIRCFVGDRREDDERQLLADALTGWEEKYPGLDVRSVVVGGPPVKVLTEASRGARLIVVGARGIGGIRGMLLGSVSRALLHHAACPIAVVHPEP